MPGPIRYVFAALLLSSLGSADTINLGFFSFDNLIPDSSTPGVNVFDISNFTGATYALPPDFPVETDLTLQDAILTLDGSAGPQQIALGDIDSGFFDPPASDQFVDTETFTSATLTAALSDTSLLLFDNSTFTVTSDTITAAILPSIGDDLTAGVDFAVITVSNVTVAPEPSTGVLLSGSLLLLAGITRKQLKKG